MSVKVALVALAVLAAAIFLQKNSPKSGRSEQVFEPSVGVAEPAPPVPWLHPDDDLPKIFPTADRFVVERHALSSQHAVLARSLGRPLEPGENLHTSHRVFAREQELGSVIVHRVKGENGAIELVVGVSPQNLVTRVSIQRLREPEPIAAAIQDPNWLERFKGRSVTNILSGDDLQRLPEAARRSGKAVIEGLRASLILHSAAESMGRPLERHQHVEALHH